MALAVYTNNRSKLSINPPHQSSLQGYHVFNSKNDVELNPVARNPNSRKRRRSDRLEVTVEPNTKRNRAEHKYLESLHLRVSQLEDLFNTASYQTAYNTQRTPETLGIGERITSLEKANYINQAFRTTLRDRSGNFWCPVAECNRSYKTAADLHVHIREKSGNGHNILKWIVDRTYCIPCDLHCNRPRDFQRHEKVSHGEAYDSRIELFLGCLTQYTPQESLEDLNRSNAANDVPAHDLEILSSQVSQPETSSTELYNVLANSMSPQPFTNSHESQAGGICMTSALTTQAVEGYPPHFSSNNAVKPASMFPFEMPPLQGPHTGSLMDFPFELSIGDDHVEDGRARNASVQHPDLASRTVPLQQDNVYFTENNNMVMDFGGHHHSPFPFNISPPDDTTSAYGRPNERSTEWGSLLANGQA